MTEHKSFGGSNIARRIACPASAREEAKFPPDGGNEFTRRGTHAHALLELALKERRESVLEFAGQSLIDGEPPLDTEDVEAVQVAVDFAASIIAENTHYWAEHYVGLRDGVGGTADLVVYCPAEKKLVVVDYKHGAGVYVSEGSLQLKFYAMCSVFSMTLDVDTVYAVVVQPRCSRGDPVRMTTYSVAELIAFADEVGAAEDLARSDNPPFCPGEEQCGYCTARYSCSALHGAAMDVTSILPAGDTVITLPSAEVMGSDPAALADTLRALPLLEAWVSVVKEKAEALAMSGVEIPGFKLVPKVARSAWADENAAREWVAANTFLDVDDYAPRKLLSAAQVTKLVKKEMGPQGVSALSAHIDRTSSGLKLVPEDAKGGAVNPLQLGSDRFGPVTTIEE